MWWISWEVFLNWNNIRDVVLEWNIYRLKKWSQYNIFERGIDPVFNDIIGFWHFCIIVESSDNRIWFFTFSSRFFRSIFTREIWEIYPFLKNCFRKWCTDFSLFIRWNRPFANMLSKYNPEKLIVSRKYLYLVRKDLYTFLDFETCINISHITYIDKMLWNEYKAKCAVSIELKWSISDWDKAMMIKQIELNLAENKNIKDDEISCDLKNLVTKWKI